MTDEKSTIGKISVRGIGCNPVGNADGTPKRLCLIYGKADGIKTGEDKNNGRIWEALTGSFEAQNLENGKMFRSGKLFLPSGIQEVVQNAVLGLQEGGVSDMVSVRFGLEIRSVKASNPIGYSYEAISIMPLETADEMDVMRKAISDARAAKGLEPLPAPVTAQLPAGSLPAPAPTPINAPAAPAPAAPAPAAPAPAAAPRRQVRR